MTPLRIRGLTLGQGAPKTIVSLMGTLEQAVEAAHAARAAKADCLEWRADFCSDVNDVVAMKRNACALRQAAGDTPLLFTFRSTGQGGQAELSVPDYAALTEAMIRCGAFDLVDVESWIGEDQVRALAQAARTCGVRVIVSHHDFEGTPSKEWMVDEMRRMQDWGADIPKIAVMAQGPADALTLLQATEEMARLYATGPLITMSMGRWGALTRLTGEVFGSALTFCALETASAPGQVDITLARELMEGIHRVHSLTAD